MTISLVVFDMAGTTVSDDGLVMRAFDAAFQDFPGDREAARQYAVDTMGQSKITVFTHLTGGDVEQAKRLNVAFESSYAALVHYVEPVDGAADVIARLRRKGIKTALTTGFSRDTTNAILDTLGWHDLADLTLTPAEAGRGRPYPDLVLTAVLKLGIDDVRTVATVGDTASDVLTGLRAGASVAAGVLTGAHDANTLREAGATHVLGSVRDLESGVLL